jgi:hypothetical protein
MGTHEYLLCSLVVWHTKVHITSTVPKYSLKFTPKRLEAIPSSGGTGSGRGDADGGKKADVASPSPQYLTRYTRLPPKLL